MTFRTQQQGYSVAQGTSPITAFVFENRDPTTNDLGPPFPIYQGWVNVVTKAIWYLECLVSANGVVTAQWRAVGPIVVSSTNPTTSDYLYPIGQTWINTVSEIYWGLVNVTGTVATWEDLSSGASTGILTLTGNSGGPVAGDGMRNVNIIGDMGVDIVGDPGTNTLTVSLTGGSQAIDSVGVDTASGAGTNPVLPNTAGEIFVTGGQIAASTTANIIRTNSLAANTYTVQVQRANTSAGSNSAVNGVAHFNSADFTIDNNAFVSILSNNVQSVIVRVFTGSGTYTPTANMLYCIVECVGGGGAGGGSNSINPSGSSISGGGGSGEYAIQSFSAATIGASQTYIAGPGGTGIAGATGNTGFASQLGIAPLISSGGGQGGIISTVSAGGTCSQGGAGGSGGSGGGFRVPGSPGFPGLHIGEDECAMPGTGAACIYGAGGLSPTQVVAAGTSVAGNNATGFGGGGSGGASSGGGAATAGGNGSNGIIIITEFIAAP